MNMNVNKIRSIFLHCICCFVLFLQGCHIGTSFRGPGFDSAKGTVSDNKKKVVFVAITHGYIDKGGGRDFSTSLENVREAILSSPGLIGYSVRKQLFGNEVWTMSAWESEEALMDFVDSPAHRDAAANGGIPSQSVRYSYLWVSSDRLPLPWDEAEQIMNSEQE